MLPKSSNGPKNHHKKQHNHNVMHTAKTMAKEMEAIVAHVSVCLPSKPFSRRGINVTASETFQSERHSPRGLSARRWKSTTRPLSQAVECHT